MTVLRINTPHLTIIPRNSAYQILSYVERIDIDTSDVGSEFVSFAVTFIQGGPYEEPFLIDGWSFPCTFSGQVPIFETGIERILIEFSSSDKGLTWFGHVTRVYAEGYSAPEPEPGPIILTSLNALVSSTITDLEDIGTGATVLQYLRSESTYENPNTQSLEVSKAVGIGSIQLGQGAGAIGEQSIAILGGIAVSRYSFAALDGQTLGASETNSMAILNAVTRASSAIAVGPGCIVNQSYGVAIGSGITVNATRAIGIGSNALLNHEGSFAFGFGAVTRLKNSFAISTFFENQEGDTQHHTYTLVGTSRGTTIIPLTVDMMFVQSTNTHFVPANGLARYHVVLMGIGPNFSSMSQELDIQISNNDMVVVTKGSPILISGSDSEPFGGTYAVEKITQEAGTAFIIKVASPTAFHRIRWAARVNCTELLVFGS